MSPKDQPKIPEKIVIRSRGFRTKLKTKLNERSVDLESYVVELIKRDLGIVNTSPSEEAKSRKEIWKTIPSTGNRYEASNRGRIRHVSTPDKILAPQQKKRGDAVHIQQNKRTVTRQIRRLVVEAFYGPIPEGYWVTHLDGDKSNHRADNLRIVQPRTAVEMYQKRDS